MDILDALEAYIISLRAEGLSERTADWVKGAVKQLVIFLGSSDVDIASIDVSVVRKFILWLGSRPKWSSHPFNVVVNEPLSPHTINCYVRALQSFFAFLLREDYLKRTPFSRVKPPKVPIKEMRVFTPEELKALLRVPDRTTVIGFRNYAIMSVFLDGALRNTELCGVDDIHVKLDLGHIHVFGKGGKERLIPIGFKLTKILLKYRNTFRPQLTAGPGAFFTNRDGNRLDRGRIGHMIREYGQKAGLSGKRVGAHTFRSTMAVNYLRNGGDPFSLQRILGHSSLTMTRRYCALADTDVKAAHIKFGVLDHMKI